jgi:hypothetical protein
MIRDLSSDELLGVHGGKGFWQTFAEWVSIGVDPGVAATAAVTATGLTHLRAPSATFANPFDNPANGGLVPEPDTSWTPGPNDISPS